MSGRSEKLDLPTPECSTPVDDGLGFIGNYKLNLDNKNRLIVPNEFRAILRRNSEGSNKPIKLLVTIPHDRYLKAAVMPVSEWGHYIADLERAPVLNLSAQQILDFVTSAATQSVLDPHGRIRLERSIVELAQLEKRVVVTGRRTYFLVWSEKEWTRFVAESRASPEEKAAKAMEQMGGARAPVTANPSAQ
ncbi:hypothetical protein FJY63_13920 [Candidatus Sumerlaeota bacterium]|nr:hypothetical protein [Candidatus Sumerlaeota bacterium]